MEATMITGPKAERIRIARNNRADAIPSPRRLASIVTAGAAALAVLLAASLPARAGGKGDDLAKALIAALVVGAIIHETRKDDPAPAPVHKKKRDKRHKTVPTACALEFEGERKSVTVYPESCLQDFGVRALPEYCAKNARIYGEWDRIYGEKCLREAGFQVQR
jgi:hypothetical protein